MSDSKYHREWYHKNKDRIKDRKRQLRENRHSLILAEIRAYKAARGCMECGEEDPIVLDFDHRDPENKKSSISDMIKQGYGLTSVMEEVTKCDVLCANCHRRKTAEQFGWE